MKVRRVVTGHDGSGKAVFVSDLEVEPITVALNPGAEFHRLWGGDEPPSFPDDGAMPRHATYFPPVGGYRFGFFTLPPADQPAPPSELDVGAALADLEAKLPGMLSYTERDEPGMHTTDTIDFEVVLSGRVTLELDDGTETELHPGDTVVQNGTRHRWRNLGDEPTVIAVFIVGANRD
jgi:mannose-6-phosphate isomerase-like protein (cupin superfamily)